ncbi:MAG: ABC transporter substrate-binding protein [Bacteroidota bacterium]
MHKSLLCFILICTSLLISCKNESATSGKEEKPLVYYTGEKSNEVVVHFMAEPEGLHPVYGRTAFYSTIMRLIHNTLTRVDLESGKLAPSLAKSLPEVSEDGLVYTFEVHPDAAWEDGTPITAADVLFSYKVLICPIAPPSPQDPYLAYLKGIELDPENDRKVSFIMNKPYVINAHYGDLAFILDQRVFDPEKVLDKYELTDFLDSKSDVAEQEDLQAWASEFYDEKYGREEKLITGGSGPYELEKWYPDQQIILKRKDNYWGKNLNHPFHSQYPDKIIFRINRDLASVELELKQEKIDVTTSLSSTSYNNLKESESIQNNFHLMMVNRPSQGMLILNLRPDGEEHLPIFTSKAVRKAVSHVLPIDMVLETLFNNSSSRSLSPVPKSHPDFNVNLEPIPFDPNLTSKILQEDGWADTDNDQLLDKEIEGERVSLSFAISYPASANNDKIIEAFAEEMRKVGIGCEADGLQMPQLIQKLQSQDFDAILLALTPFPTPYPFEQNWHSKSRKSNGGNYAGYSNTEVDALIDSAEVAIDPQLRQRLAYRIQDILVDELPIIPLFNPTRKGAVHQRFNNYEMFETPQHIYLNNLRMIRPSDN